MKADFSRGFNPDQKRAKFYRRVLLQQGRVLLDSDAAALVDANDRLLRDQTRDLGTDAGGRGHAFLVTAGHLYSVFDTRTQVTTPNPAQLPAELRIDYNFRFRTRFPSLLVRSGASSPATINVKFERPHFTTQNLVIWAAADPPGATLTVAGALGGNYSGASPVPSLPPNFQPLVRDSANNGLQETSINITIAANQRVWIGLIESAQTNAKQPFWIQPGRYHVDGLMASTPAESWYPDQGFPAALGFPVTDPALPVDPDAPPNLALTGTQCAVAFLESWERLITSLHDPGIREQALSASLDTSVRTQAIAQVKAFVHPTTPTPAEIQTAFANRFIPNGTLDLTSAPVTETEDPCDITLEGGFTGRENHLYHFEVHSYNASTGAGRFKWSREAGSELFGIETIAGTVVGVSPSSGLRDGNIVEVLNDVVELGDAGLAGQTGQAQFTGAGSTLVFRPSQREVGVLAVLRAQGTDASGNNLFGLFQVDSPATPVVLDTRRYDTTAPLAAQRFRLRRWHGLFPPVGTLIPPIGSLALEVPLESNLIVKIHGQFEVGDFWQREARLKENANGAPVLTRHGPERLFSPLALLVTSTISPGTPEVSAYLDEPFVPAAELDAEHIKYDQTVALMVAPPGPMPAPTVQGMLDHLLVFGPGNTITERITHIWPNGMVTGNWQMSVGDGLSSFGDFNGTNAIKQAVEAVRTFVGAGQPWSLSLFVKRGAYTTGFTETIELGEGEELRLVGEGFNDNTPFNSPASTHMLVVQAPAFFLSGNGAKLEIENIAFARGAIPAPFRTLIDRQLGRAHLRNCRLQDVNFELSGSSEAAPPEHALILEDCVAEVSPFPPLVHVNFGEFGTCPKALFERCDITLHGKPLFSVDSAVQPVRAQGMTARNCHIKMLELGSSPISPFNNPGLVEVLTVGHPDGFLTIGDIAFENCNVDTGAPGQSGIFLHLPSGNDPAIDQSVGRIDNVVIRGGRWTIHSDTMTAGAIYIGKHFFQPNSGTDSRITNLNVENVQIGWATADPNTVEYGRFFGDHTCIFYADNVNVRNLTFFGLVRDSEFGELAILGGLKATVNGILLDNFHSGGAGGSPEEGRVKIIASLDGASVRDVTINGILNEDVSLNGLLRIEESGAASSDRTRVVLTNCKMQNSSRGFFYVGNTITLELIDCSTVACSTGIQATIGAVTPTTVSTLVIRGGLYTNSGFDAINVSITANYARLIVDGATIIDCGHIGIVVGPSGFVDWQAYGPTIINNRIVGTGDDVAILVGQGTVNNVGGICMGNHCIPTTAGNPKRIHIRTQFVYFMRGLHTEGSTLWASIAASATPPESANAPMVFNYALWSPT